MAQITLTEGITDDHLAQVYADPYIVNRISSDGRRAAPVIHPLVTYLSAFVDGEFVGAFLAVRYTPYEFELHSLLHKSGIAQSRELAQEFLRWAFDKGVLRVTAPIIEGLETAKNFCIKLGFTYEGFRRDSLIKDGLIVGVHMLGMTRTDWSIRS